MKSRIWLSAFTLGAVLAAPGIAQQTTTDDLNKQIVTLTQMMQGMQRDLAELKVMLSARAAGGTQPSLIGTEIDVSDSRLRGDPTAKLTLVEFSDYQCGFCARYMRQTFPQIEAEYIKTGKINLKLLDMPIGSLHKLAFKAAETARCAGEQGKYWEMHDLLFTKQEALEPWSSHAEALGLDVPKFNECLAS